MLNNWFFIDWLSVDDLSLGRHELDSFSVVDDSSLVDWLGEDFFCWSLEIFIDVLNSAFDLFSDLRMVNNSGLSSVDL